MQIQIVDSVKHVLDCIISKEKFNTLPKIDVTQGSEVGDGYIAKTYAISIEDENGKRLNLFVKYLPEVANVNWKGAFEMAFRAEFRFYSEIYPTFNSFQKERNVKVPFNNVPKHFRAETNGCDAPPIVLENLRCLGYRLRDRKKPVDKDHLVLPIKAFARFHAISYAMKDQNPEVYERLHHGLADFFTENLSAFGFDVILEKCVNQFLDGLDPIKDKRFFDHCKDLPEILMKFMKAIPEGMDEYSAILQGDCWSNNMMFLYDEKSGLPIDVKLIDWQCQRVNSPLLDFSYFFYTLATKEHLDDAKYYLNLYYDTLSQRIKELGSDPDEVYPYNIFLEHWKKFALFGLSTAFSIVKIQLFDKDETPDLANMTDSPGESFSIVLKDQDKYIKRMKDLVEYFIDKGLI